MNMDVIIKLRNLSYVERFNLLVKLHPQNVATHSLYTAYLTLYLIERLKLGVNPYLAATYAILHDVEEAYLGDIILPTKNGELGVAYRKTAEKIKRDIFRYLGIDYIGIPKDVKHIVKVADMLEAYIYAIEEVKLGNRYFVKVAENYYRNIIGYTEKHLPSISSKMEEILQELTYLQEAKPMKTIST